MEPPTTPTIRHRAGSSSAMSPRQQDRLNLLKSPPHKIELLECALCSFQSRDPKTFDGAVCGKCAVELVTESLMTESAPTHRPLSTLSTADSPDCDPWLIAAWLPPLGVLGAHLCLTGRRRQALLYGQTCGLGLVGWLSDLASLRAWSDRGARDRSRPAPLPTTLQLTLRRSYAVFATAFVSLAYASVAQYLWTYSYPDSRVPIWKCDARSLPLVWRLAAHAVLCLATAAGSHLTYAVTARRKVRSFALLVVTSALAIGIGELMTSGLIASPPRALLTLSLPAYTSVCTTFMVVMTSVDRPAAVVMRHGRASSRPGTTRGLLAVFLGVLSWWLTIGIGLLLHAEVAMPDLTVQGLTNGLPAVCGKVLHNPAAQPDLKYWQPPSGSLPNEWLSGRLAQAGTNPAWSVPAWHAPEYTGHLLRRCTQALYDGSSMGNAGVGKAEVWHRVALGPLLAGNPARALSLLRTLVGDVHAGATHGRGGWWTLLTRDLPCSIRGYHTCDLAVLGLGPGATLIDVKTAYRGIALSTHSTPSCASSNTPLGAAADSAGQNGGGETAWEEGRAASEVDAQQQRFRDVTQAYDRLVLWLSGKGNPYGRGVPDRAGRAATG